MKRKKLILAVKRYIKEGFYIHNEYKIGENYAVEKTSNTIIELTIPKGYYDSRFKVYKNHNREFIHKTFSGITRECNAIVTHQPNVDSLSYENSLRWLYHHYPYGDTDNKNVVLVNGNRDVIAVNYHGLDKTSVIISSDCITKPYFVYNNKKKVEKRINIRNGEEELDHILKLIYNN